VLHRSAIVSSATIRCNSNSQARWRLRCVLVAVLLALLCGTSFLSAAYPQTGDVEKPQVLDEVTVEAHRQKLSQLRRQIKKSVDDFFAAFNKANTVPGYDTRCGDEKPSGSNIASHICRPRFVADATEQETQGFFYGYPTIPAAALVSLRMRGHKKRLQELMHTDPNVRHAAADFETLTERYAAVSKKGSKRIDLGVTARRRRQRWKLQAVIYGLPLVLMDFNDPGSPRGHTY